MATRKASLIVLFFVSTVVTHFADSTLLSVLLISIWPQVFDRTWRLTSPLEKDRQIFLLKLAFASLPLILLIGGLLSFFDIALSQANMKILILAIFGIFCASLLLIVFAIFPMTIKVSAAQSNLNEILLLTLQQIRFQKGLIFSCGFLFCGLLAMSIWIPVELSVILSFSLTCLFMAHRLHWHQLQPRDSV